ncbi:hypothetical protein IBX65_02570 [Candidatus Aerophobetes bacterium]|nr:hypothetical protein [Candidatus Aerophobetes bacterium]
MGILLFESLNTEPPGVVHIPRMQELLRFICKNGFEHHVAINLSSVASEFNEAIKNYLGIETYWHS